MKIMNNKRNIWLMACPHCDEPKKITGKKANTYAKYKVSMTATNFIIFKCVKCKHTFKARMIGKLLSKADFDKVEVLHVEE